MHEIEIKLRVAGHDALLRRLERLRARRIAARVHETNVLFDTPRGDLRRRGEIVRIRVETPAAARGRRSQPQAARGGRFKPSADPEQTVTLTYKGPVIRQRASRLYKMRAEEQVRASSAAPLMRILRAAGLEPCFCYEKYRQTFRLPRLPGLLVELDETPIGDFLELEGKPAEIDRAAALLGYAPSDYINKGYPSLYFEAIATRRNQKTQRISAPAKSVKGKSGKSAERRWPPGMFFPRRGTAIGH